MMRRFLLTGTLVLLIGAGSMPGGAAAQSPTAFVRNLGTQAISVLGPNVSRARRLARFRELFRDDFDVPGIGRFVLGRYWRVATPQQQRDFLRLFQEYIVQAYSARLSQYSGEPFRVTGSRRDGSDVLVTSEIVRSNGNRIRVDWYLMRAPEGGYKITDVYVAGVSMKVTQRDEFASVIQRSGGRVEGLLARLRQKVAEAR